MEVLKHECGVAMVRLLKPLEYYHQKYGTWMYGLNKLYLQPAAPAEIWIYSLLQSVFGIVSCTLRGVIIGNTLGSGYCNKPVFSHTIFHTLPVSVYPVF